MAKNQKMKKRLTRTEEFEIMKLVLDKFLWAAVAVLGFGFYKAVTESSYVNGVSWMVAGVILLALFVVLIVREYEIIS